MSGSVNYLKFLITGDGKQLEAELDKSKRTVTGYVDSVSGGFSRLTALAGGLFAGVTVAGFVGKLVSVQREFDVLNSSLVTVTGSSTAAAREMSWIERFAKDTPYGLAQATEAFVKMQALGLSPTEAKLTSFGNTASAMGKDLMQMVEAVADASTGEFERLKEFGIKASKEGDKVTFTFQGIRTTVQNTSADITSYLESIGNTAFGGAMAERAQTLDGAIAGLGDSWDGLFRKINESTGATDKIADGVRLVSDGLDALGSGIAKHQGVIGNVFAIVAGAGTAAGAVAVGSALMGPGGVVAGITAVRAAFVGLTAVMAANPVGLALLGVGALTGLAIANSGPDTKSSEGLAREISFTADRIAKAEAQLAAAGGPKGGMTAQLETRIASMKKYRDELQAQQTAIDLLDPRNQMRFKSRGASFADDAARKVQEEAKAEEELAEIRRGLYGVSKDYLPTLEKLHKQYEAGRLSQTEYVELVSKLAEANYKADSSTKAKEAAAKAEQSAYDSLVASIRTKVEQVRQELLDDQKLTESQKLGIKLDQDLVQGKLKLSAARQADIRSRLQELALEEKKQKARQGSKLADELLSENAPLATDFYDKWNLINASFDGTEASMQRIIDAQRVLLSQQPFAQQAAALQQARAEAEQYLAVMQQARQREVQAVGMGDRQRGYLNGLNQIEDGYANRRYDLSRQMQQARDRNGGVLPESLASSYAEQLRLIDEFERKAKASYASTYESITAAQGDWVNGANRAFANYADSAADVAGQTASLFTNAFSGMENALVSFVQTGKLDFKSLADSIISELIRIQVRAAMGQAVGGSGGGWLGSLVSAGMSWLTGGSGSAASGASSLYSLSTASNYSSGGLGLQVAGQRADGGPVAAGAMYEVNERGIPELLNIAGRQFLMMGRDSGRVEPLDGAAYSGGGAGAYGSGRSLKVEIIKNGEPAQLQRAEMTQGANGEDLLRIWMDEAVKASVAEVSSQAAGRFGDFDRALQQRERTGA